MKKKIYKLTVNAFSEIILEKFDYKEKIISKIIKRGDKFLKTIYHYDNDDKICRVINSDGYQENYTYDRNGNLTEKSKSDGFFEVFKYDENNHLIYTNNLNDEEFWYKYDEKGNETYFRNHEGYERLSTYKYDDFGNITFINSEGSSVWRQYDSNGHLIYVKRSYGQDFSEYFAQYDGNKLMYEKTNERGEVREIWHEYENNNLVYSKDSNGKSARNEYDMNGNRIFSQNFNGEIIVTLFDEFNNKIFYRDDDITYWKCNLPQKSEHLKI